MKQNKTKEVLTEIFFEIQNKVILEPKEKSSEYRDGWQECCLRIQQVLKEKMDETENL